MIFQSGRSWGENNDQVLINASQNGMTGSDSQAWVMLRIRRSAVQSHKRKEPVNEESKVCRFGCPCRDDCDSDSDNWGSRLANERLELSTFWFVVEQGQWYLNENAARVPNGELASRPNP